MSCHIARALTDVPTMLGVYIAQEASYLSKKLHNPNRRTCRATPQQTPRCTGPAFQSFSLSARTLVCTERLLYHHLKNKPFDIHMYMSTFIILVEFTFLMLTSLDSFERVKHNDLNARELVFFLLGRVWPGVPMLVVIGIGDPLVDWPALCTVR